MLEKKKARLVKQLGHQVRDRVKWLNKEKLGYELCWNGNMAGACLMASYMLRYALRKHGIFAELKRGYYRGNYHWWLVVDSHIVDLTATQFGMQAPVYITDNTKNYSEIRRKLKRGRYALWPKRLYPPQYTKFFKNIGTLA